jgi:putative mRNA 3-end processing factor
MIRLSFNGALSTVGASAVVVETPSEKIVMDYGTKVQEVPPKFPIPVEGRPDAIIATHCHMDHTGGLPIFFKKGNGCPIYATNVTKPLTEMLLNDSIKISREEGIDLPFAKPDVKKTIEHFKTVNYRQPFRIKSTEVTCYDAGHIPGSLMAFLKTSQKKSILYTGDLDTKRTRMLEKADTNFPKVDVLVTESTYSGREHLERKSQEKMLIQIINDTLAVDGTCLVAGFAVGRIDEILLAMDARGIDYPVFIDGMAKKGITIINSHKSMMREPNSLDRALEKAQYVEGDRMRKRLLREPCVILSTSGMLSGGPIVQYIRNLHGNKNCSLVLTSYQVEGTPGKTLLETGRYINEKEGLDLDVQMFVKHLDFSSHCGRTELFDFVEKVNPERVFCIHGDHTEEFADELKGKGFNAIAPLANNRIFNI